MTGRAVPGTKKAPGDRCTGPEGMAPQEGTEMGMGIMMAQDLRIGEHDDVVQVYYSESATSGRLLRVHYKVKRLTGRPGEYLLVHLAGATDEDRASAIRHAAAIADLDVVFADCQRAGVVRRRRFTADRRRWVEYVCLGTVVEDPLTQLELEMMIDETRKAVV